MRAPGLSMLMADFNGADAAEQKAIAVGVQSAQIFDHAGHIAQKLNRSADATKYFQLRSAPMLRRIRGRRAQVCRDLNGIGDRPEKLLPRELGCSRDGDEFVTAVRPSMSAHGAPSLDTAAKIASPTFPPVPEALLIPSKLRGRDRLLHSSQGAVERNPVDAQSLCRLGRSLFPARL